MKHKLLTTAVASSIALTSIVGVGSAAFGEGSDSSSQRSAPSAEQIAQRQAERAEKLEERLTTLVEEGQITENQKEAILEFFEENRPEFDAEATREERQAAHDEFKEALEEFAEENDIDLDLIKPDKGPKEKLSEEDRAAKQEEHLSELVEDGTITEEQKEAIIAYREENKPDTDPGELTPEERRAQRDEMRTQFEEFLTENGIDVDAVKPPHGAGGRGPGGNRG